MERSQGMRSKDVMHHQRAHQSRLDHCWQRQVPLLRSQLPSLRDQAVRCWWSTPTPVAVVAVGVHTVLAMCQYSKEQGHLLPAGGLQLRQKTPNN